jgi:hypothetical protein
VSFPIDGIGKFGAILSVKGPRGEQHNYAFTMDAYDPAMEWLHPQDRDRELRHDWMQKEDEVRKRRAHAVEYIAHQIACGMLDHLHKTDPKFGYSDSEWQEMTRVRL